MITVMIFKVILGEEFIVQISNYQSLKKYCAGRKQQILRQITNSLEHAYH